MVTGPHRSKIWLARCNNIIKAFLFHILSSKQFLIVFNNNGTVLSLADLGLLVSDFADISWLVPKLIYHDDPISVLSTAASVLTGSASCISGGHHVTWLDIFSFAFSRFLELINYLHREKLNVVIVFKLFYITLVKKQLCSFRTK